MDHLTRGRHLVLGTEMQDRSADNMGAIVGRRK